MNLGGLSPDKAPPVEAPLTLFYLLPFFLVLAGVLLTSQGDQLLASRWTPATLAATHFLVLGALAPVMCGALLQISPVLFGAPYPKVQLVATLTAIGLGLGGLGIGFGFLLSAVELLLLGAIVVVAGLGVFLLASYRALAQLNSTGPTLWTVRLAIIALAVTIALGSLLALSRSQWIQLPDHLHWVDAHATWGIAGWIGLLLAGIGMEIIPMFYVSPGFPKSAKRLIPPTAFALLTLMVLTLLLPTQPLMHYLIAALFSVHLAHNLIALYIEHQRRRGRHDANLWLWQFSHIGVLVAFAVWLGDLPDTVVGILLIGSALAFVIGSLTKIVPFLSWLDLQQRRISSGSHRVKLPHMHALLSPGRAAGIAATLVTAILLALAGQLATPLAHASGVVLTACGVLVAEALFRAVRLRRAVERQLETPHPQPAIARHDAADSRGTG